MADDVKKGLLGIVVDETEISKVMPEINSLTYRGYAAQDLCEYCKFEEVAYLILNKDLPNSIQLKKFEREERNNRELSKDLYAIIKRMPKKSHPMDVARTAVSFMGLEDKETSNSSPEANMRKALRIFAKTPTALAAFYRLRKGKKIIKPKKKLSFAENFFYMCFGKVPQKEIVKAFDVSLILYAEHSFNVSTFTARTITSSLSDIPHAVRSYRTISPLPPDRLVPMWRYLFCCTFRRLAPPRCYLALCSVEPGLSSMPCPCGQFTAIAWPTQGASVMKGA